MIPQIQGEKNFSAKLTEVDVARIRAGYPEMGSMQSIGEKFGVSKTTICHVIHGNRWAHSHTTKEEVK